MLNVYGRKFQLASIQITRQFYSENHKIKSSFMVYFFEKEVMENGHLYVFTKWKKNLVIKLILIKNNWHKIYRKLTKN